MSLSVWLSTSTVRLCDIVHSSVGSSLHYRNINMLLLLSLMFLMGFLSWARFNVGFRTERIILPPASSSATKPEESGHSNVPELSQFCENWELSPGTSNKIIAGSLVQFSSSLSNTACCSGRRNICYTCACKCNVPLLSSSFMLTWLRSLSQI